MSKTKAFVETKFGNMELQFFPEVVDTIVSQPRDKTDNPIKRIEMKVQIVEK